MTQRERELECVIADLTAQARAAWKERDALRAELDALTSMYVHHMDVIAEQADMEELGDFGEYVRTEYRDDPPRKVASPAPSVPDGWLRAVDEALVVTHLGVANVSDTYEVAKRKLDALIGWRTDVATDPAVNGGFKLVPVEPTCAMLNAQKILDGETTYSDPLGPREAGEIYRDMLAAAPKPEVK